MFWLISYRERVYMHILSASHTHEHTHTRLDLSGLQKVTQGTHETNSKQYLSRDFTRLWIKNIFFCFCWFTDIFNAYKEKECVNVCVCEKLNDHIRTTLYHTKREKLRVLIGWSFSELLQLLNVDGSDFTDTPPIWGCQSHSWILYETLQKKLQINRKKWHINVKSALICIVFFKLCTSTEYVNLHIFTCISCQNTFSCFVLWSFIHGWPQH